jgi:hypothetical protein
LFAVAHIKLSSSLGCFFLSGKTRKGNTNQEEQQEEEDYWAEREREHLRRQQWLLSRVHQAYQVHTCCPRLWHQLTVFEVAKSLSEEVWNLVAEEVVCLMPATILDIGSFRG